MFKGILKQHISGLHLKYFNEIHCRTELKFACYTWYTEQWSPEILLNCIFCAGKEWGHASIADRASLLQGPFEFGISQHFSFDWWWIWFLYCMFPAMMFLSIWWVKFHGCKNLILMCLNCRREKQCLVCLLGTW